MDAETRYLLLEKLALALVHATRKLPHYFQALMVYVLIEHPLQSLLRRFDFMRRIAKWGTRLGSFDVRYKLRNAIKEQVLVDFVVEFTPTVSSVDQICQVSLRPSLVYVDKAFNAQGARVGIVLVSPKGVRLECSLRLSFKASKKLRS